MRKHVTLRQFALKALPLVLLALPMTMVQAQNQGARAAQQGQFADGIAAIVGTEVITMRQLQERMAANRVAGSDSRGQEQILQGMIDELLVEDEALRMGLQVSDARMQQVIAEIAANNNMSPEQLREAARQHGIEWDSYVEGLRNQVLLDEVRGQVLLSRIHVTPADVDAYIKQNPTGVSPTYQPQVIQPEALPPERRVVVEQSFEPMAIALQHIHIRVPDNSSEEVIEAARKRANEALQKIRGGASFEAVAREYSNAPEASQGGNLGIRMFEDWPKLFVDQTRKVRDGRVSGVFRAPNGFHILKVVERRGIIHERQREVMVQAPRPAPIVVHDPRVQAARQEGPVEITDSHVRHILIRFSPIVDDEQAHQRIIEVQQAMQAGMSFSDAAEKYSQDSSAPIGGDIGWISPGQADPAFEQAADSLQIGQVSEPVRSSFGWHLIEVLDRRTEDKQGSIRKSLANEAIFEDRAAAVIEDWIEQLRGRTFIDNRLDRTRNR
ncbi:MAG: peptidylprolyl isomerase [Alcaligenaceae bacterium]|nr:peptidylprolyl isomerase [Alcaligenaceae bacterium]